MHNLNPQKVIEISGDGVDWPQAPLEVTDGSFDETIKKYPFVVVDCWAAWCGPCRMIGPVIEELAKDYAGRIVFAKLDVDNNQMVPGRFGIMSIPTLLLFKAGNLVDQKIGAMPREMLEPELTKHL